LPLARFPSPSLRATAARVFAHMIDPLKKQSKHKN
jgi:hypothetical protein